ncbi:MAG: enoyl-CoA hydratase, partial [Burkholderiaceae bacterium]
MTALPVDTEDFTVEICDDGIAEIVFGPEGRMPTTDGRGHRELAHIWSRLAAHEGLRAILV